MISHLTKHYDLTSYEAYALCSVTEVVDKLCLLSVLNEKTPQAAFRLA